MKCAVECRVDKIFIKKHLREGLWRMSLRFGTSIDRYIFLVKMKFKLCCLKMFFFLRLKKQKLN